MKVDVEVRIQMKDGGAVVLDSVDAKELFEKLKELYGEKISYPFYPSYYPSYYPWRYSAPITTAIPTFKPFWTSTSGGVSLSCGGAE